jgi:hypothetical protein
LNSGVVSSISTFCPTRAVRSTTIPSKGARITDRSIVSFAFSRSTFACTYLALRCSNSARLASFWVSSSL